MARRHAPDQQRRRGVGGHNLETFQPVAAGHRGGGHGDGPGQQAAEIPLKERALGPGQDQDTFADRTARAQDPCGAPGTG